MNRFFMENQTICDDTIIMPNMSHITNVMRHKVGEMVCLCDGNGTDFVCEITDTSPLMKFKIISRENNIVELPYNITLFQAFPKADKFEQIVQKTTELGVAEIVPLLTNRVVNIPKSDNKWERFKKIALEASRQCGRGKVPTITPLTNFSDMVKQFCKYDLVIFPYELEKRRKLREVLAEPKANIAIVIGSEGGFEQEEVAEAEHSGAVVVTLGNTILRTETAGVATIAMINFAWL